MRVLMSTNGQKHAEEAIHFAGGLLQFVKPRVTVTTVIRKGDKPSRREEGWLKRATKILDNFEIEPKTKIREGDIAEELLKESKEGKYDLLVIGSRRYSEILAGVSEVLLGGVAQEVIQQAKMALLVVKKPKPLHKVLICTDGSRHAEEAMHFWGKSKISPQPKVNVVNVVPEIYGRFKDILEPVAESQLEVLGNLPGKRTEYLYRAKSILEKYGIQAKIKLREGHAAEEILKESENDYDLIIMGTGGRKGNRKNNLGRQTRRVMRQAKIPVLAIRPMTSYKTHT